MNNALRRTLLAAAVAASLAPALASAQSGPWPNKPIRWVVPFAPGGLSDSTTRAVTQRVAASLGQPVVVENRAGANGGIGSAFVAKSPPDGYTYVSGSTGTHAINPHLYKDLQYDALKDFAAVSALADYDLALIVNAASPNRTLAALLAANKTKPGGLSYGSSGVGASNHLVSEMLGVLSNNKFVHVPYKGDGPALIDLMGGQIDFMFTPISSALQYEKVDKVRLLATTGAKRSPETPNVPVAKDVVQGMEFTGWNGVFTSAGTPAPILARMAQEITQAMTHPDVLKVFQGVTPAGSTPEVFAARVRRDYFIWEDIVKRSGAKG